MSSDPNNTGDRDPVHPAEDATQRIDPVSSAHDAPQDPAQDAPQDTPHDPAQGAPQNPVQEAPQETYSAGWPAAASTPPQGEPTQHGQPAHQGEPGQQGQPFYGQQSYGQEQYGQQPYGQNQYGQLPYGQQPYGQDAHGNEQYGQQAYGQNAHGQQAGFSPYAYGQAPGAAQTPPGQRPPRPKRTVGVGGLALAVVLAGLLGGGVGAGTAALLDDDGVTTSSSGGVEINNPETATVVTAAAAKASPSVVTLAVSEGGQGGSGSGIILDDQGHVLTNTHVVTLGGAAADPEIQVRMNDGSVTNAEVVGTDPLSDLAVVQLEDVEGIQPAELGSSADLNVGNQTIAIGSPLGLAGTVTDGIVSTLNRTISVASSAVEDDAADAPDVPEEAPDSEGFEFYFPDMEGSPTQGSIHLNVIQTDAAINRGNSGGALVDDQGRVIGVNVAIASSGGAAETDAGSIGVGFAVPIDYAQRVAEEIIANGEVSHGLLGVTVAAAGSQSGAEQDESGAPTMSGFTVGALIDDVPDGSPAQEAGLQAGDIITAVNDRRIEDSIALTATIREYAADESVTVTYQRDGQQDEVEVTLGTI
ncbi:trypsin-like peptidase domain-containing protein [Nesterenkonia halotolerans]|uniref:S1C family serine protease n=1 Tax=Nesterenkonia halotolerans TaxID=225325 RepID=UPI003EE561FD